MNENMAKIFGFREDVYFTRQVSNKVGMQPNQTLLI